MNTIITPGLVSLDKLTAGNKREVIDALAGLVGSAGRSAAAAELAADVWAREETSETGMPGGIAIPHCRTGAVTEATLAFARLAQPVDFGSTDGPADLVFMIAAPDGADQAHLKILSALATSLINDEFLADLRSAETEQRVVDLVAEAVQPAPVTANAGSRGSGAPAGDGEGTSQTATTVGRLVAVTACPTGIAHTYMAADSLKKAAKEAGVEIQVETQGSSGATPLGAETIAAADAVIFATDVDVRDRHRFAGKPVITSRVKRGIDEPDKMIAEALAAAKDPDATVVASGGSGDSDGSTAASGEREGFGRATQRVLMTGVSYMIPFVAAGGLLIALGFLLGGYNITEVAEDVALGNSLWNLPTPDQLPEEFLGFGALGGYLGAVFFTIGGAAMGFLVPALAGYIAFGMADRPGIAPGFTAGAIALTMDAGFIGGIVGGVLAGAVALWFRRLSVPRWLAGLMPVVIIPLVASLVAGGLMLLVLGGPIAALTSGLENWLSGMTGSAAIVLGIVLGLMMCFDLGGPVNKVAYSFAVAGLSAAVAEGNTGPLMIMATVMAAGMVPPLGMAFATFIDARLFSAAERENGKTAVLLGAAFISEGAIPFAAADPLRVLPASMVGGAVTGAMTMAFGVTSYAPHGGIFVPFAIESFWLFLLSVMVGAVVTALTVIALKRWVRKSVTSAA
ncbi:fructose-specific PTS transporter subunit EIIC [Nesterenkonia sp. LB17]|uniref:PTS fructose transporter subunit IIABC n=1 Tax=unclassified Nesterenkonia TaxID=2629769 RepID=UPI001F4CAAE0|nr:MULTISPECIES: fructose-specific PTS transporter subunit EIIC [unclassified Nesterenkonia]MCH8560386.1 fructose-specific PTS transporter subunit EIIC [Nesterenkonia sp. DZ6]MCH8565701.1 fructose-specific PTS transporter subunit EIIC [Nesterenkonia sp. LB17]